MTSYIPTILKVLFFTSILLNIKSFPLAYTLRSIKVYITHFKHMNDDKNGKKRDLFQTIENKHTVLFDDLDVNIHMSNSSYNKVLDYERASLIQILFASAFRNNRNIKVLPRSVFVIFNHEIPAFAGYSVHSRILTWDQKWIFMISYFRLHSDNKITSLGISRIVFKEPDGKTIKPMELFEASGYFKNESEEEKEEWENRRQRGMKFVEGMFPVEQLFDENFDKNNKIPAKL